MSHLEYLLSYGALGDFGRFYAVAPLVCRRGQRAVIRSHRGVELGTVLGPSTPGHAAFLPNTTVGQLLRLAGTDDLAAARRQGEQAQTLFARARQMGAEQALPLEVIDVEMLLDGEHAVLHYLRFADFDPRPFVSFLSKTFAVHLTLQDMTGSGEAPPAEEHGCGRPGCGSEKGGCGSEGGGCATGGGCSTCGLKNAVDMRAYFARLRAQMERTV
jgi:cell fate regulator YaaT (PSP1 superfamily)